MRFIAILLVFLTGCQTMRYTSNDRYADVSFKRPPENSKVLRQVQLTKWDHFFFFGNISAPENRDIAKMVEGELQKGEGCYNLQIKNEITFGQGLMHLVLTAATLGLHRIIWDFRSSQVSCDVIKLPEPATPIPLPSPSPSPTIGE